MIIPQSEDMSPIVMSFPDGDTYEITPHLWQRNQQQSQIQACLFCHSFTGK